MTIRELGSFGIKKLTLISGLLVSGHLYDISVQLLSNITWRHRLFVPVWRTFGAISDKPCASVLFLGGICVYWCNCFLGNSSVEEFCVCVTVGRCGEW